MFRVRPVFGGAICVSPDGVLRGRGMDTISTSTFVAMQVRKRNGTLEPADVNKIVRAVARCCDGLPAVDPLRVATKTISGLYDGATTRELDGCRSTPPRCSSPRNPSTRGSPARLLATYIDKEVEGQEIHSFSQSVAAGYRVGLFRRAGRLRAGERPQAQRRHRSVTQRSVRVLRAAHALRPLPPARSHSRSVIETPQHFFLRVACGVASPRPRRGLTTTLLVSRLPAELAHAVQLGHAHAQLSSCFLLDSPRTISRPSTAITATSRCCRSSRAASASLHARSQPRLADSRHQRPVERHRAVAQDARCVGRGRQPGRQAQGRACVYLEPWHADIEEFLELRDNTGDEARRTHNLTSPTGSPTCSCGASSPTSPGRCSTRRTCRSCPTCTARRSKRRTRRRSRRVGRTRAPARDLYGKMMRTLAQTGNGWMTFKDAAIATATRRARPATSCTCRTCAPRSSRSRAGRTAVCNLGSINLAQHVRGHLRLRQARAHGAPGRAPARPRDRLNFYPTGRRRVQPALAAGRTRRHGAAGRVLQAAAAVRRSRRADALYADRRRDLLPRTARELRARRGRPPIRVRGDTRGARRAAVRRLGRDADRPGSLGGAARAIPKSGLRNSLLVAIAPTATIASIAGCYECIEPQVSNLFKRETLSGDFLQVNRYLVDELKRSVSGTTGSANASSSPTVRLRASSRFRKRSRSTARPGSCRRWLLIDLAASRALSSTRASP